MLKSCLRALFAAIGAGLIAHSAVAHDNRQHSDHQSTPTPATLADLELVKQATARYLDVDQAVQDGYVDIGVYYDHMGWHYLKSEILDDRFDADQPELLVYQDDPCSGKRRLVAVEYALPLALADRAPAGFPGKSDGWTVNERFQLWTLHAWLYEYNPDGVFAAHNMRLP